MTMWHVWEHARQRWMLDVERWHMFCIQTPPRITPIIHASLHDRRCCQCVRGKGSWTFLGHANNHVLLESSTPLFHWWSWPREAARRCCPMCDWPLCTRRLLRWRTDPALTPYNTIPMLATCLSAVLPLSKWLVDNHFLITVEEKAAGAGAFGRMGDRGRGGECCEGGRFYTYRTKPRSKGWLYIFKRSVLFFSILVLWSASCTVNFQETCVNWLKFHVFVKHRNKLEKRMNKRTYKK